MIVLIHRMFPSCGHHGGGRSRGRCDASLEGTLRCCQSRLKLRGRFSDFHQRCKTVAASTWWQAIQFSVLPAHNVASAMRPARPTVQRPIGSPRSVRAMRPRSAIPLDRMRRDRRLGDGPLGRPVTTAAQITKNERTGYWSGIAGNRSLCRAGGGAS
jgi:hypothetical protein